MISEKVKNTLCPTCRHPQTCPCKTCQERRPSEKPWIWKGDDIQCAVCGLTMSADEWLNIDVVYNKYLEK